MSSIATSRYSKSLLVNICLLSLLYIPFNWLDANYGILNNLGLSFNPLQTGLFQYGALIGLLLYLWSYVTVYKCWRHWLLLATILTIITISIIEFLGSIIVIKPNNTEKIAMSNNELGWIGIPGASRINIIDGRKIKIRLNSLGIRGPEVNSPVDLMFIGNSVTFAQHVDEEETFSHLLKGVNAGFDGYNTMRERDVFRRYLSSLNPHILVLVVTPGDVMSEEDNINNIRETLANNNTISKKQNIFSKIADDIVQKSRIYYLFTRSPGENQKLKDIGYARLVKKSFPEPVWEEWTQSILDIKNMASTSEFVVFLSPPRGIVKLYRQGERKFNLNKKLEIFCRQQNIKYIDPLPALASYNADTIFHDFIHYNATGHSIVSNIINDVLKAKNIL